MADRIGQCPNCNRPVFTGERRCFCGFDLRTTIAGWDRHKEELAALEREAAERARAAAQEEAAGTEAGREAEAERQRIAAQQAAEAEAQRARDAETERQRVAAQQAAEAEAQRTRNADAERQRIAVQQAAGVEAQRARDAETERQHIAAQHAAEAEAQRTRNADAERLAARHAAEAEAQRARDAQRQPVPPLPPPQPDPRRRTLAMGAAGGGMLALGGLVMWLLQPASPSSPQPPRPRPPEPPRPPPNNSPPIRVPSDSPPPTDQPPADPPPTDPPAIDATANPTARAIIAKGAMLGVEIGRGEHRAEALRLLVAGVRREAGGDPNLAANLPTWQASLQAAEAALDQQLNAYVATLHELKALPPDDLLREARRVLADPAYAGTAVARAIETLLAETAAVRGGAVPDHAQLRRALAQPP